MTLEELQTQVEQTTEVGQSAIVLIEGLAQKLEDVKDDPAQIQAIADALKLNTDALAAAVIANTPSA